jgi:hypothetical protein
MTTMGLISRFSFAMTAALVGLGLSNRFHMPAIATAPICCLMFVAPMIIELAILYVLDLFDPIKPPQQSQ